MRTPIRRLVTRGVVALTLAAGVTPLVGAAYSYDLSCLIALARQCIAKYGYTPAAVRCYLEGAEQCETGG